VCERALFCKFLYRSFVQTIIVGFDINVEVTKCSVKFGAFWRINDQWINRNAAIGHEAIPIVPGFVDFNFFEFMLI
jgi:hypothetical protein